MDCQSSESKKVFKVFDASKRKRSKKKRNALDDTNSINSDGSISASQGIVVDRKPSKPSCHDIHPRRSNEAVESSSKRERDISPDPEGRHASPRRRSSRHRRSQKQNKSLALKMSTPRSLSPSQEPDGTQENASPNEDSFIYSFLEEAIKIDKKKRKEKKHEDRPGSPEREQTKHRHHRHRNREKDDASSTRRKQESAAPQVDQMAMFETLAKLCVQLNDNKKQPQAPPSSASMHRTISHKSLHCQGAPPRDLHNYDVNERPTRLSSHSHQSYDQPPTNRPSHEAPRRRESRSYEVIPPYLDRGREKHQVYDKDTPHYYSKSDVRGREMHEDRRRDYSPDDPRTRSRLNVQEHPTYRDRPPDYMYREREFDERTVRGRERHFEEESSKTLYDKKISRSVCSRDKYTYEDRGCRPSARSEFACKKYDYDRDKRYDERDIREKKLFDERRKVLSKEKRRPRKNPDTALPLDRISVTSREDDFRDSGLSVADGENSTVSARSNYLRVVKQEIAEQREAMDKMMKLWKELMKCFKGIAQPQDQNFKSETAENARESAAAQLRLWRECMRRYETVARDVGDTDARLMEEINKQRSEMSEMATMWQECLQRYREMSNDFNNLKQKLVTSESPARAPAQPPVCAEADVAPSPIPYRMPPTASYQMPPPPMPGYCGSPLRSRASAPPVWSWWCGEGPQEPQRRQSSPDSRGSRERDRRRRHKDRDDSRYREKPSKTATRSEHRHRRR